MGNPTPRTEGRTARHPLQTVALGLALMAGLLPGPATAATGDSVLLNEALASHTGTDTTEFVELFGVPGTPLAGLSLVAVEGDGATAGTIDRRVDFPAGARLGGNGFYLVGNPTGLATQYGVVPDLSWGNESLENGSQTLALVATAGLGAQGTGVTGTEDVRDAFGLTDAGPTDAWFWSAPVVGPDDGFLPGGARRLTDGVDTDAVADWAFADDQLGPSNTPTPSTPYNAPPVSECGSPISTDEGVAATGSVSASDPDGRVTAFAAVGAPSTITVTGVVVAPAAGGTATAVVEVAATTPPGTYVVTVTASNDDPTPQSTDCVLSVTVNDLPDPTPGPTPVPPEPSPTLSTAALWGLVNALKAERGMASAKMRLLTDRLERIDRYMASGQISAAAAQLQALANQVRGLSPRWLSVDDATALADAAADLRAALAG